MAAPDNLVVPSVCDIDDVDIGDSMVIIQAHISTPAGVCPLCLRCSARIHSDYKRTIYALPFSEYTVCLKLRVRRYMRY